MDLDLFEIADERIPPPGAERDRWRRAPRRATFFDERAPRSSRGPSGGPTSAGTGAAGGGGTYQAGLFGEEVVADGLERAGWMILGHRVRTKVGEIDLVARRNGTIVFAEVKTAGPGRLSVEQAVDRRSRFRIRRAAVAWMAGNRNLQRGVRDYRFDVFLVRRDKHGGIERIEHVRNAF